MNTPAKQWPFVETPGEFSSRLNVAMSTAINLLAAVRHVLIENPPTLNPIDMILHCPNCGMQHIDAPERDSHAWCNVCKSPPAAQCYDWCTPWTNPPHRSHLCGDCGHIWRPADVPTNGVAEIPTKGEKDSPRPLVAVDRVPRGMRADAAEKLIRECFSQAGYSYDNIGASGINITHQIAQAAHKAGFTECLTRVGLGDKS